MHAFKKLLVTSNCSVSSLRESQFKFLTSGRPEKSTFDASVYPSKHDEGEGYAIGRQGERQCNVGSILLPQPSASERAATKLIATPIDSDTATHIGEEKRRENYLRERRLLPPPPPPTSYSVWTELTWPGESDDRRPSVSLGGPYTQLHAPRRANCLRRASYDPTTGLPHRMTVSLWKLKTCMKPNLEKMN